MLFIFRFHIVDNVLFMYVRLSSTFDASSNTGALPLQVCVVSLWPHFCIHVVYLFEARPSGSTIYVAVMLHMFMIMLNSLEYQLAMRRTN